MRTGTPRGPCPRFNFLSIGAWAFYQAMWSTNLYYHLTYWTLMVHVMYFSIDKSSPNSRLAAQVMQGMSFCGAFSVMLAYSFICVFGSQHFGSWLDWENALGAYMGTITAPRSLMALSVQKFFEHYWPPMALVLDARLCSAELRQIYAGWSKKRGFAVAMGAYFAYVTLWENVRALPCVVSRGRGRRAEPASGYPLCGIAHDVRSFHPGQVCTGFAKGDAITIYQQPPYFRTAHVLAKLGIPAPAAKLPEDLFFLTGQKAWCILVTLLLWRKVVGPLFSATSEPVTSTRTTRAKDA